MPVLKIYHLPQACLVELWKIMFNQLIIVNNFHAVFAGEIHYGKSDRICPNTSGYVKNEASDNCSGYNDFIGSCTPDFCNYFSFKGFAGEIRQYAGFTDWIMAVAIAVVLNIILFGLMPALTEMSPQNQDKQHLLKPVQVVVVRQHHRMPLQRQPVKEKSSLHRRKIKIGNIIRTFRQNKIKLKPELSTDLHSKFLLNPISDRGIVSPDSLPVMDFAVTGPVLKGSYRVGELDTPLIPIVRIPPVYPAMAMRNNIEGWVKVRFVVTDKGRVKDIKIVKSVPGKIFNGSVIKCVSRWRFRPGTVSGVPVNTLAETTIKFKLEQ